MRAVAGKADTHDWTAARGGLLDALVDRDASAEFTAITEAETAYSGLKCVYLYRTGQVNGSFHNVLFPPCQKIPREDCFTLGERQVSDLKHLGQRKVSTRKNAGFPEGETMLFPCRSAPPIPSPPSLTLPRSKAHTFDILEVVFSTTGDLIRVHSYGDHCSATWDACLTYGRLESEGGKELALRSVRRTGHGWTAFGSLPLSGWLRSRQITAPGWPAWPLASSGSITGAMG